MDTFLAFLGISIIVIVTPGPDTAITIRSAMAGGLRGGAFTALGVATGLSVWALAAAAGITALLVASEPLFFALKMIGAAYLIYLGAMSLWSAFRAGGWKAMVEAGASRRRVSALAAYRTGLVSNLSNPKIAAFFTSVFPQFVPHGAGGGAFFDIVWLGLTFAAITLVWLVFYSWGIERIGNVLQRPKIRRTLDAVMGAILVALGLRLATEQR
ncbi:MAG TPA: LysE family translocator [Alphaproteobacteria bacterium]|jgi:threonine/homoserine/homoserine lactone efflux protein